MAKEKFWFKHDYGATGDTKLSNLLSEHGLQGIGLYWVLIEKLYENNGEVSLDSCKGIAYAYHIEIDFLKKVITDFHLFKNDGVNFWSDRVKTRLGEFSEKSEKARESINKRWNKNHKEKSNNDRNTTVSNNDANALRMHSDGNTNVSEIDTNVLPSNNDRNTTVIQDRDRDREKIKKEKNTEEELKLSESADSLPAPKIELSCLYKSLEKSKHSVLEFIRANKPEFIQPYADLWNVFAHERGLPKVIKTTNGRKKKFKVRIKEAGFDFIRILKMAKDSEFLLTGNWFGFDWIIENDSNYVKVLEGNYKRSAKPPPEEAPPVKRFVN